MKLEDFDNEEEIKINDINVAIVNDITFDTYDIMKQQLITELEKYNGLVVNEDNIKDGKKIRAKLNKLKKKINDRRIEIKKKYDEPFVVFKDKIDSLIALIEEPIKHIDNSIKEIEANKTVEEEEAMESFVGASMLEKNLSIKISFKQWAELLNFLKEKNIDYVINK